MEKNIIALLHNNLRVIIPEFGAFIIRQKHPRVVVFNEFLRYNDGLLIDYLVKNEGIDKEVAEHQVSAISEEWMKALNSGNLVIPGLGTLQKDNAGKIIFTEEGKPESVQVPAPEPVPEPEPAAMQEIELTPEVQVEARPRTKRKAKTEVPSVPVPEPQPTEEIEPVIDGAGVEPNTGDVKTFDSEKIELVTGEVERNRTKQVLFWVILFLVVNAVVIGWFVFGKSKHPAAVKIEPMPTTDSLFDQLADSVRAAAMDTSLVFQETPADETESAPAQKEEVKTVSEPKTAAAPVNVKQPASVPTGLRFYIVVGSFKDEANADTYLKALKKKGYSVEKVKRNQGLYSVCFGSYETKDKANQELNRIRDKFPEAWISQFK